MSLTGMPLGRLLLVLLHLVCWSPFFLLSFVFLLYYVSCCRNIDEFRIFAGPNTANVIIPEWQLCLTFCDPHLKHRCLPHPRPFTGLLPISRVNAVTKVDIVNNGAVLVGGWSLIGCGGGWLTKWTEYGRRLEQTLGLNKCWIHLRHFLWFIHCLPLSYQYSFFDIPKLVKLEYKTFKEFRN